MTLQLRASAPQMTGASSCLRCTMQWVPALLPAPTAAARQAAVPAAVCEGCVSTHAAARHSMMAFIQPRVAKASVSHGRGQPGSHSRVAVAHSWPAQLTSGSCLIFTTQHAMMCMRPAHTGRAAPQAGEQESQVSEGMCCSQVQQMITTIQVHHLGLTLTCRIAARSSPRCVQCNALQSTTVLLLLCGPSKWVAGRLCLYISGMHRCLVCRCAF